MRQASDAPVHERFHQREARSYWGGLLVAVGVHFALFAFAPGMTVDGLGGTLNADETVLEDLAPPIPPPPADEDIVRPRRPVPGDVNVPDYMTIPRTSDFSGIRLPDAPPPIDEGGERIFEMTPRDVDPTLRNTAAIQRLLVRSYPPAVRDAGIGGTVTLWLYVDEAGSVLETRLREPSGIAALDQAALGVAARMQFRPAQYRGRAVPVWVAQRIEFTTK